jgi:hypothetical protein
MDKAMVAAELERAFGENPTASNGEKRLSQLLKTFWVKVAPMVRIQGCTISACRPLPSGKLKRSWRKVISWRAVLVNRDQNCARAG